MSPQHAIVESTQRLLIGQRHKNNKKFNHRKQSEKWDGEYKHVYSHEGRWEGEDHQEGCEKQLMMITSSQSRRETTYLYSKLRRQVEPRRQAEKERREGVKESELKGGDHE